MNRHPFLREFLTGAMAILATFALFAMLWRIGDLRGVGVQMYEFTIRMTQSGGIADTTPVSINGFRIGRVKSIKPADPITQGVDVTVSVRGDIKIPRDFGVYLDKSFIGEASLDLTLPTNLTPEQLARVVQPGDIITDKPVATLFSQIGDAVTQPLSRLEKTADSIDQLASTLDTTGKHLNDLLEPRTPAEQAAGKPPNLRTSLTRVERVLDSADLWLRDEQLLADIKSSADRLGKVLDEAAKAAATIERTAASIQKQSDDLGPKVTALTTDAAATLKKIDAASTDLAAIGQSIQRGEGTLGQLVRNPDLYRSLNDASQRLDKALQELQLLLEKYRTEGLPIKF